MTRDEIISGLEREIKSIRREPRRKMLGICMTVDEAEDIVALLKEQEAVEPKKIKGYNPPSYTLYQYKCAKCETPVVYKQPFCMGCGRRLNWE